jgi:hypothetical protein
MQRPFSMMLSQQPITLDYMSQLQLMNEVTQGVSQLECKKNKTSKQAEKKRKKRKTGADISIRFK